MALHLILGPMFSSKTTELIRLTNRERHIGRRVLMVNHAHDIQRNQSGSVRSHDGVEANSVTVSHMADLGDVDGCAEYDVIAIDEGQFFDDIASVQDLVRRGIVVYVAALDGDFQQHKFGHVLDLIPLADTCVKLHALCDLCRNGTKASFTVKKVLGCSDVIDIGGEEKYMSVCRQHLY